MSHRQRQYLNLFILFGITLLMLGFTVDVTVTDEAGVKTELPARLGDLWTGHEVLFCHNQACMRSWLTKDLEANDDGVYVCKEDFRGNRCGGKLHPMAYGEWRALPRDTVIFKKQYFHNDDEDLSVYAGVVLSGSDRSSIHRPELCMPSQGHSIESRELIEIPLEGRDPLQVMILNLSRRLPNGVMFHSYYAYWFVGHNVETPHHMERMLLMATDRIFRNVSHRWAYISLSGPKAGIDSREHHDTLREVVPLLYPQISLLPTDI